MQVKIKVESVYCLLLPNAKDWKIGKIDQSVAYFPRARMTVVILLPKHSKNKQKSRPAFSCLESLTKRLIKPKQS